jgi:hypothetical protein
MISVNSQAVVIDNFNSAHSVNLGSAYSGTKTIWTIKFATAHPGAWDVTLLEDELYGMPIQGSSNLTDSTSNIIGNIINTNVDDNVNRNTIIEMAEIL